MATLRALEAAVQLPGFKWTAARLHCTPRTISHQIRCLEAQPGAVLFHRDPAGLRLTGAGRACPAAVSDAFDGLAEATSRLWHEHGDARVAISLFPSFAVRWLIPRLNGFRARCLEVGIEQVSSVRQTDFGAGGVPPVTPRAAGRVLAVDPGRSSVAIARERRMNVAGIWQHSGTGAPVRPAAHEQQQEGTALMSRPSLRRPVFRSGSAHGGHREKRH